jgi:hypothetical protein
MKPNEYTIRFLVLIDPYLTIHAGYFRLIPADFFILPIGLEALS